MQRTKIEWTKYRATEYAEGFGDGENATAEEQMEAWGHLIKTGLCWQLQGWYGRNAARMIEAGLISKEGEVNWQKFDENN